MKGKKPTIGITIGDINGIGPELILKTFLDPRMLKICTPIIYGSSSVINYYKKSLHLNKLSTQKIASAEKPDRKKLSIIDVWNDDVKIQPGKSDTEIGKYAFQSIEACVNDVKEGLLDAMVTAPISKENIQSETFKFPGHTEYLAKSFDSEETIMILASDRLKVAAFTGHIPLKEVSEKLNRKDIVLEIKLLLKSLREDFGIAKPRIAVLGFNPHAGDNGLLGDEEKEAIIPAISTLRDKEELVFGPYAADGFFGSHGYKQFDAVFGMYHDQVLTPFKALVGEEGVNFTAGISGVRTSPAHGTAFDIAGKNVADPTSFRHAIFMAIDVARKRHVEQETEDLN